MELREPQPQRLLGLGRTKKLAVYILSALIIMAMIVWIGVLSWGLLTVSQWLVARFNSLWSWL